MKNNIKAYGVVIYLEKKDSIKILLCKSVESKNKWGCLKGVKENKETSYTCAIRELYEESSIKVDTSLFEEYFEQKNKEKDIGIWLVNAKNIPNLENMFNEDKLHNIYLSWENSKVKFFDIKKLPPIKKKQEKLISQIKGFLKNKHQHH